MHTFYGNYYVYLCVYSNARLFMRIYTYFMCILCVYVVMGNYSCLFLINVYNYDIYSCFVLKVCKKTDKIFIFIII